MRARAEATARTRGRILDAVVALAQEKLTLEVVMAEVAERAGVSVPTVLRHFGSREGLFEAAREHGANAVVEERETPVGDVEAAVAVIVAHYERRGAFVLSMLAQARFDPAAAAVTEPGKGLHRSWVETTFAPWLLDRPDATAVVDLLVVATDVYTWSLVRRDAGRDRATTEARMLALVRAVLATGEARDG